MSGNLVFGQDRTNNSLHAINVDSTGVLAVEVVAGGGVSDATAANQILQLTQETSTALNTLSIVGLQTDIKSGIGEVATHTNSIDGKITSGSDTTLAAAQQVLCYGEVTSGPGVGELHPIHITNAGDVEVEIADFVKGQDLMAASFPVVISSDQSILNVDDATLNTTLSSLNAKVTSGADTTLATAQQFLSYGQDYTGALRPLKVSSSGRMLTEVDGQRASGSQLLWSVLAGTTAKSSSINMDTHTYISFYGDTDNVTDQNFDIEYSQDGTNWFQGSGENAKVIIVSASGNFYDEEHVTPPQIRLSRTNTTGSLESVNLYHTRL
jgi:hypothetical protein